MSFSASAVAVCLIACHGGPVDHFVTFAESLSKDVRATEVYASGPTLKKLQKRGIEVKVEDCLQTEAILLITSIFLCITLINGLNFTNHLEIGSEEQNNDYQSQNI